MSNHISEEQLEAAACEALGAHTAAESAAYQQTLATTDDQMRDADRGLRETAAHLAAASPYMKPSADLRGRVLQATAPVTFKMEDYRKATRDNSKFYRWGFYAAMLFLMAGAWYNSTMQTKLTNATHVAAANGELADKYYQQAKERDLVIGTLVDPKSQSVLFTKDNKPVARAQLDLTRHLAVLIAPSEIVPPGKTLTLHVPINGRVEEFQTATISAPAKELGLDISSAPAIQMVTNPPKVETDTQSPRPLIAGQ